MESDRWKLLCVFLNLLIFFGLSGNKGMAGIFKASMATVEDILSGVIVRIGKWGDDKKGAPNLNLNIFFLQLESLFGMCFYEG